MDQQNDNEVKPGAIHRSGTFTLWLRKTLKTSARILSEGCELCDQLSLQMGSLSAKSNLKYHTEHWLEIVCIFKILIGQLG